jgi:Rrf2 family iron-sulfur cluster assembly transcriptional regulator
MRLYKSSEYAIRCLVFMAYSGGGLHSVKSLSDELDIPYKFLGRLMSLLGSEGVVESVQGKNGGFRIVRPLEEIRLAEIVNIVEGLDNYERCILGFDRCDEENPCPMHEFWVGHKDGILHMLKETTLAQLAESKGRKI